MGADSLVASEANPERAPVPVKASPPDPCSSAFDIMAEVPLPATLVICPLPPHTVEVIVMVTVGVIWVEGSGLAVIVEVIVIVDGGADTVF